MQKRSKAIGESIWKHTESIWRHTVSTDEIKALINAHREKESAQAVQGMWQAYGQIRAGRMVFYATMGAALIATVGLYKYRTTFRDERKQLELAKKELQLAEQTLKSEQDDLNLTQAQLDVEKKFFNELTNVILPNAIKNTKIANKKLDAASNKVQELCKGDETDCYRDFLEILRRIEVDVKKEQALSDRKDYQGSSPTKP